MVTWFIETGHLGCGRKDGRGLGFSAATRVKATIFAAVHDPGNEARHGARCSPRR